MKDYAPARFAEETFLARAGQVGTKHIQKFLGNVRIVIAVLRWME